MADISVKFEDGTSHVYNNVPDSVSRDEAIARAQKDFGKNIVDISRGAARQVETPKEDKSSTVGNLVAGAVKGASNIGATILQPIDWAARQMGVNNDFVGYQPEERRRLITEGLKSAAQAMGTEVNPEATSFKTGELATEIAGTAGAPGVIAKPLIAAGRAAPVVGNIGRAIESAGFNVPQAGGRVSNAALRVGGGAAAGGATAGMVNPEEAGAGAMGSGLFGAVSKPIMGAVESAANVGRRFMPVSAQQEAISKIDAVKGVADTLGIDVNEVTPQMANFVNDEVNKALKAGKSLDVEALARKADFESLGIKPLRGQITRNPTQFAQERNIRGVGTGIQERLTEQNQALQGIFGEKAAGAVEPYQAGNRFIDTLRQQDEAAKSQIDALYKTARDKTGRFADIDHVSFVKTANDELDQKMLGRFLPEQSRALLNDIAMGKIPLNVNNLVQVDSVLSAAQRSADSAGKTAIGVVRNALHDAPISSAAGEEAKASFDVARNAARNRFKDIESNPALKAIIDGKAVPEDFVSKFIVKGKTDNVQTLASALRNQNPEAFNQARQQMALDIQRAAFGENVTADSAIRPEMLARKLREIGTEKMSAFFSPEEITQYNTAMRVANYIEKHPNAAPVNTSNTMVSMLMQSPIVSGLEKIPGVGAAIGLGKAAARTVKEQSVINRAMNADVPTEAFGLTDTQRKALANALGKVGGAVGVFSQ